jgi:hypothetical protein
VRYKNRARGFIARARFLFCPAFSRTVPVALESERPFIIPIT